MKTSFEFCPSGHQPFTRAALSTGGREKTKFLSIGMSISIRQLTRLNTLALMVVVSCTIAFGGHARAQSTPLSLHPDNPHYLLWRGKPTLLVTSGEHYGAVMNAPFDYVAYLDELQSVGLNLTRLFSGVYCEDEGFASKENTLCPGPGNLLCPFARSDTPGYAKGGNKFDLGQWDEAYFKRLKDFVAQAGKRGIVVEFVFFCPYYEDSQWNLSPFNARNNVNVNDIGDVPVHEVYLLKHPKLLGVQQALVRKIVTELKDADNVYYEILNEGYWNRTPSLVVDPHGQLPWQHKIADTIVEAEKDFANKHLIAQNSWPQGCAPGKASKVDKPYPAVSIYNFHNVETLVEVVDVNCGLNKVIGQNETGPSGQTTAFDYRRWGWTFILAGGAIYNNLDYSFTVRHPKGEYKHWDEQPGGAMAAMRKQLRILKDFMEGFDFIHLKPDTALVKGGVPAGGAAFVLAKSGEAYAIYLYGGKQATLILDVPAGRYRAEWVNTLNGKVDKSEDVPHGGGALTLGSPEYKEDVALRLVMVRDHAPTIRDLRAGDYPGRWAGRFIWDRGEAAPRQYHLMLRKTFDLAAPVAEARVHIAVADRYLLYVNGRYVGRGPCRSIGPKWISYDTQDVAAWLKPGTNTLAVHAYFYAGGDIHPFSHFRRAGLFVQIEAGLAGGSRVLIGSDESWKVRAASGYRRDTSVGNGTSQIPAEIYEAGRDPEDWVKAEYNDSSWDRAVRLPDADWQHLEPRVTPLPIEREVFPVKLVAVGETDPADAARFKDTEVAERLTAEKHGPLAHCKAEKASELIKADAAALFQSAEGHDPFVILDFGQPCLGIPRVVFEAPKGTVVEMTYAATRLVDGRVPAMECGRFGDRYVARDGLQTWQPFEFQKATRQLQLVFRTGGVPVRVHSVSLIAQEYPARLQGSFACSDETLTRLWRATIDTVYLHLEDAYLNDPVRERWPYLLCGELEQSHLAYYAAYGDIAATELNFQHTTRSQLANGVLAWGTGQNYAAIPTFSLFYAQAVLNRHRYFAKPGFLQQHYPALVRVEQWCQENTNPATELLDRHWPKAWVWLDWPTAAKWDALKRGEKTRAYFYIDALHCQMLEDMSEIAERLGKPEDSARWQARAAKIRQSMRCLYWDPERRLYADLLTDGQRAQLFSELINGMALLYGIATPEQSATIVKELTPPRADLTRVSPLYIYYVLEGLIKSGAAEYSYRYLAERYAPTMAASDFPTLWEGWSGETPVGANNTSTIHGGGAGVAWALTTHVLGITPLADGFKQVRIAPEPGALAWAKGTLPSAAGHVSVSWRKHANDYQLEATLPEKVRGELVLPRPDQGLLRLVHNGMERSVPPVGQQADGVEAGQRTVTLQILPGNHRVQLTAADKPKSK